MRAAPRISNASVRREWGRAHSMRPGRDLDRAGRYPTSATFITAAAAVAAAAGWILSARRLRGRTAALERDGLTGVWRREGFERRAPCALAAGNAIALLDLDGFKQINDAVGHAAGDMVLRAVAGRLVAELGESALIARLGGDEFAVITTLDVPGVGEQLQALSAALCAPVAVPGAGVLAVDVSLGVAWLRELPAFAATFDTDGAPRPCVRCCGRPAPRSSRPRCSPRDWARRTPPCTAAKARRQRWRVFDRDADPVRAAAHMGPPERRRYRGLGPGWERGVG